VNQTGDSCIDKLIKLTLLTCSLTISGCDAVNCIVNNHPEFSKNSLSNATLNQVFEDAIRVSISNSYMDSEYNYTFHLEGDLPQGITYGTSAREITFSGTPTELGDFPVQLSVVAVARTTFDIDDEPEGLCSDTESRDMVFSVIQGF